MKLIQLGAFLTYCIFPIISLTAPAPSNNEAHCNLLGALSKAFAEARDQGMKFQKAQRKLAPLLTQNKIENQRAAEPILALTGGLAYTKRELKPITLFALNKYLCLSSYQKVSKKIALKYFLESAKICQTRMLQDNKIVACMKLAYELFLKDSSNKTIQ